MKEKVSVNAAGCRSKFGDFIFFFPFSLFLSSDAAAISTSIVFIAESRERGSQKGKLGCSIVCNMTSRVDLCTSPLEKKTISQPTGPTQMFMLHIYKAASV